MAAEDGVGRRRGELAPAVAVAGLQDHRVALRAARHGEVAADVELLAVVLERPGRTRAHELPGRRVGDDLVLGPRVPQLPGGADELAGPHVAVGVVEEAAAPEVLAGERVRRRDDVPRRPPARQVVERGQLAGQLVGLVVRGVERAGQPEVGRHPGQRGEDRQRVGPADDVEVVDLAPLLAQPQPLGEEEEVELAPLGGLGEVDERVELDLALGRRVAPHARVVHAGEVGAEDDLLARRRCVHASRAPGVAADGAGQAEPLAQRARLVGRAEGAAPLQRRHDVVDDGVEVVAGHRRPQPEAVEPEVAPGQQLVGQLVGRADERSRRRSGARTRRGRRARPRRAAASAWVSARNTTRSANSRSGGPSRPTAASAPRTSAIQRGTSAVSAGVTNTTSADVAANSNGIGWWASAATIGWPCGGRGTIDGPFTREEAALEVDVVQLVAVDEAAGGDVLDDGVVLPAVPQPAHDLDDVGGLVEQVARAPATSGRPVGGRAGTAGRRRAASSARPDTRACHPPRPLLTQSSVEMAEAMWNGSGYVVVTVGTQPDVLRGRRHAARRRATASRRPRTWSVRSSMRRERAGLDAERVVERDEVEQAPLGRAGLVDPVARP